MKIRCAAYTLFGMRLLNQLAQVYNFFSEYCRRDFASANASINLFKSIFLAVSFYMHKIAKHESLSWEIVLRRQVLISFNFENERSHDADDTGSVRKRTYAAPTSGKLEDIADLKSILAVQLRW